MKILRIEIIDPDYTNDLIVALTRQGYTPYFNPDDEHLCINVDGDELEDMYDDFMNN